MRKTASGDAEAATDATPDGTIPARNLPLSAEEHLRLILIIRHRQLGYMISMNDCDFLLEILERVTRC